MMKMLERDKLTTVVISIAVFTFDSLADGGIDV